MAKKTTFLMALLLFNFTVLAEMRILVKDQALNTHKHVSGEIIVKFKPGTPGSVVSDINSKLGTSVFYTSPYSGFKKLRVPKGRTLNQMVERFKKNPNVEYAELNYIANAHMAPNDTYYSLQWNLDNSEYGGIKMESAWDISTGVPTVIVAVIDTGVAYEDNDELVFIDNRGKKNDYWTTYKQAPDLAGTFFVPGYDFVNDDAHPNDDDGHGTHVTGTIAQSTNNGIGLAGIAFNCSIMPVKVLDSDGSGTYADIADGIWFAADNGANVINMSLGGPVGTETLKNALAYAYGKGVTIVCSAGNDSTATVSYPAAYNDYCIAVGATRYDETVAYYSNTGSSLDITAPGGDVTIDQNGDGYGDGILQQTFGDDPTDFGYWFYQGTSMAAPHVSGVAALLISAGVAITPDDVREVLQSTAEDKGATGRDDEYGWGIVDAYAALNYSVTPNTPPVAVVGGPYAGDEDASITFDGSGSSDPDGDTITYSWDFGDNTTGSGANPVHTYNAGGEYTVTLVVNDGRVNSEPSTTIANIVEVNDKPVAAIASVDPVVLGTAITFDGSGSYDIDAGDTITYSWDFGDTTTPGSGINPVHTYSAVGTYTVTLTVTDVDGLTDTATTTVSVTEESTAATMTVKTNVLTFTTRTAGRGRKTFRKAFATVTIVDKNGVGVVGATVSGTWNVASITDSGVTDNDGKVILESEEIKNASEGDFNFVVTDVSKAGWIYE